MKMKEELPSSYLSDPEKYCDSISTLIQNGSDEWQTLWQSAIKELFHNSENFQNPVNNINAINSLLKVIEKAFKERVYRLRVQAFECWQYFIVIIDTCDVSDKLLNVLLIPLCASNHSVFEVLRAKLRTWATLLDSNLILRPTIMKKGVPNLLKILYGPHALRQASEFDDLVEVCGNIYLKMLEKCVAYETIDILLGSLERAIPILTKNENTRDIANSIWTNTLEHISKNNWPASQFNNLIKTFQNLVSSNSTGGNILINSFLTVLIEMYGSFPVGYLKLNMALFSRCLFHVPKNNILNLMECLMKKCQDENLFFNEIVITWHACAEEYKNELYKYWLAAKTCFLTWEKREEASDSTWVLLLPVKHLHYNWDVAVLEQLRSCYDEILHSNNADSYTKTLCENLAEFISESENPPLSFLNAAIDLCKIILQSSKRSDGILYVKLVLMAVFLKIPSQDLFISAAYKSFAPKFVATILFFLKEFPENSSEFAPVTRLCGSIINGDGKDSSELSVVQLIKKYNINDEGSSETVLKPHNGVNVAPNAKTNVSNHIRTSFLSRLSSSAEKKRGRSEMISRLPSTPKSLKSSDEDNDIQFIAIKPRPKNSPMTEHQKEISKSRSYIPALYEDLSQSQSQSQSESISLLSNKAPAPIISGIEYFEEDANLPPERNDSPDDVENTLSTGPSAKISLLNAVIPAPKKSLFKDKTNEEDKQSIPPEDEKNVSSNLETVEPTSNDSINEISSSKRRSTRFSTTVESVPPKRIKRVTENITTQKKASEHKVVCEEKKKRGRPNKGETNNTEVQEVNIVDTESQNLFVSASSRLDKLPAVSSPLNSLMNVRNSNDSAKTRRKSLKSKSTELPTRSPIATRKRKSSMVENVECKKPSKLTDECSSENSSASSVSIGGNVFPCTVIDAATSNDKNSSKAILNEPKRCDNSTHSGNDSDLNCSVIIIESASRGDIISISDSGSPSFMDKTTETKNVNSAKTPSMDVSDESTFFEDAEMPKKVEKNICLTKIFDRKKDDGTSESGETGKSRRSILNESFPEKLVLEETEISNADESEKVHQVTENVREIILNSRVINQSSIETNVQDRSPTKCPSSPLKNKLSPTKTTTPEKEENYKKETPSPKKLNIKTGSPNDVPDVSIVKRRLIDEISDKGENQPSTVDLPKINTSPISNNTRTLKIMKMACDSQSLAKPKNFGKSSKSPLFSGTGLLNLNKSSTGTNQRTMKILMANNGGVEKPRSSPTKVMPTSTERLKYYPKECTSPGILKKPDLSGSFSSPKSAKFVNFAEQLTLTRTFDVNEENYYDSYNSDDPSNSNLINDDEATSQEILYSPLLNCSDDVKHVIERLSLSKAAVDLFHRMGIKTVGHLASISTLTAKSIPAGDNRLQRLRKALKDYDEWRTSFYESKGLRIPSARRRILCRTPESILEISSLIELMDEAESIETSPAQVASPEVQNGNPQPRMPTVVLAKLSEENCPSLLNKDEIMNRLEEQSSPIKANKSVDSAQSPTKNDFAAVTQAATKDVAATIIDETGENPAPSFSISVSSFPPSKSPETSIDVESGNPKSPVVSIENVSSLAENEVSVDFTGEKKSMMINVSDELLVMKTTTTPSTTLKNFINECFRSDDIPAESSQPDINEDPDLIYTATDEQTCARTGASKTHSKRVATCEYIAALRNPLVSNQILVSSVAPSPEIVTVEIDDDDDCQRGEEIDANAIEKEGSMSIFSPDVTSRTVNRQTEEVQSQCASQSVFEASKTQLDERSLFTVDETAASAASLNLLECDDVASAPTANIRPTATHSQKLGEGVFCQLLSVLWEPFLTDRLKQVLISDEKAACIEYTEIIRKNVTKLRELREAGLIGDEELRDCGLVDFVNEINLLKK